MLQDQAKKRLERVLSGDSGLEALMSILNSNPGYHNTYQRQQAFERARIL